MKSFPKIFCKIHRNKPRTESKFSKGLRPRPATLVKNPFRIFSYRLTKISFIFSERLFDKIPETTALGSLLRNNNAWVYLATQLSSMADLSEQIVID